MLLAKATDAEEAPLYLRAGEPVEPFFRGVPGSPSQRKMLAGCSLTRLSRFSYAVPHAVQSTDPGLSISAIRYYTLCRRFFILILFTDDRGAHIDGDVIAGNRPARARIATSWRGPRWRLPEARRPGVDIIAGARVADSALEGTGFEPSVPPRKRRPSREVPRPTIVVSRDDVCLMTPSSLSARHLSRGEVARCH